MRLSSLFAVLLFGIATFAANDSAQGNSLDRSVMARLGADVWDSSADVIPTQMAMSGDTQRDPYHRYLSADQERIVNCLKMRSYLMAREDRHSDVTHMVGYTTCTPTSKYEVRTSVKPLVPDAR